MAEKLIKELMKRIKEFMTKKYPIMYHGNIMTVNLSSKMMISISHV